MIPRPLSCSAFIVSTCSEGLESDSGGERGGCMLKVVKTAHLRNITRCAPFRIFVPPPLQKNLCSKFIHENSTSTYNQILHRKKTASDFCVSHAQGSELKHNTRTPYSLSLLPPQNILTYSYSLLILPCLLLHSHLQPRDCLSRNTIPNEHIC